MTLVFMMDSKAIVANILFSLAGHTGPYFLTPTLRKLMFMHLALFEEIRVAVFNIHPN